jgi:Flp pilus assembly protein TadB
MLLTSGLFILYAANKGVLPTLSNDDERYGFGLIPLRILLGAVLGTLLYMYTGWPVACFYGVVIGFLSPSQWLASRRRREAIERVEAIATWAETLRDTMAASAGLQQALRLSAAVAPRPIRTEVRAMVSRLQYQSVPQALRKFAGDIRHPLADQVVASIILASQRSAGSLRPILAMTSAAARDSGAMQREVEAARSNSFQQARLAVAISVGLMLFMIAQNREFLRPFDSFGGQIALFIALGAFCGSMVLLYRMSRPVVPTRIFEGIETWSFDDPGAPTLGESDLGVGDAT